jgi:hypothetical protein
VRGERRGRTDIGETSPRSMRCRSLHRAAGYEGRRQIRGREVAAGRGEGGVRDGGGLNMLGFVWETVRQISYADLAN